MSAADELRGDVLAQEEMGEHRRRQRLQVAEDRHPRGGQVRERPVPDQVRDHAGDEDQVGEAEPGGARGVRDAVHGAGDRQ